MNIGNLTAYLGIDASQLDQAQKKMSKFGQSATNLGKQMSMKLTLPLVGIGVAAERFATQLNAGMADVATLIPGNTARVEALKGSVQSLAVETGKSTTDMAGGLYQVISAFGDTNDTVKMLEINAKAATAGVATTTDAINLTSSVMKGYNTVSAETAEKAADLAFQTVKLGQTTFPELAASIGATVPLAAQLNITQEELFGTFATLTGVTGNAAIVSTQFQGILRAMIKPTEDMETAIANLGEQTGLGADATAEAIIKQLGMKGTLKALVAQTDGTSSGMGELFSRVEGLNALLSLTGSQSENFSNKLDAMGAAAGASGEAFLEQTAGVNASGFAMKQFKAQLEVMLQKLGDIIGPILQSFAESLSPIIDYMTNLSPTTQKVIVVIGGLVAVIGPLLVVVGAVASGISAILPVLAAVGGAMIAVVSPVGIVVVAIGALVTVIGYFIAKNETARSIFGTVWNIIKNLGRIVINSIVIYFKKLWESITWVIDKLKSLVKWFSGLPVVNKALKSVKEAFDKLDTSVSDFADTTDDMVGKMEDVDDASDDLADVMDRGTTPAVEDLTDAFDKMTPTVNNNKKALEEQEKILEEQKKKLDAAKAAVEGLTTTWEFNNSEARVAHATERQMISDMNDVKTSIQGVIDTIDAGDLPTKAAGWSPPVKKLGTTLEELLKPGEPIHQIEDVFGKNELAAQSFGNQVSTVFTDMSADIADAILEWDDFLGALKTTALAAGKALLRSVIESAVNPFMEAIGTAINNVVSGAVDAVTNAVSGIFGKAASGGVSSAASGGVSSAASGGFNLANSFLTGGISGLVSGLVSSLFQGNMKDHIRATEEHTRFTAIDVHELITRKHEDIMGVLWQIQEDISTGLQGTLESIKWDMLYPMKTSLAGIGDNVVGMNDALSQLAGYQHGGPVYRTGIARVHAGEYVVPAGGRFSSGGGVSVTINAPNVYDKQGLRRMMEQEIAPQFVRMLRTNRGGFKDKVMGE